jgi:hypothetical protein
MPSENTLERTAIYEPPQDVRRIIDEEHLRLLAIGHYIVGGLYIAFASIFIFHFVFALMGAFHPEMFAHPGRPNPGPPDGMFTVMAWLLGCFIVLGCAFGGLNIYVGRCIKRRSRRALTLIVACLNTLAVPLGTILGVCTLLVLTRRSVKKLYER